MPQPHDPYVPASKTLAELTVGAVIIGCLLGLVFFAASADRSGRPPTRFPE